MRGYDTIQDELREDEEFAKMIIYIDDTERGREVGRQIRDKLEHSFLIYANSYIEEIEVHEILNQLLEDCIKNNLTPIVIVDSIEMVRVSSHGNVGIFCDGSGVFEKRNREYDFVFDSKVSIDIITQAVVAFLNGR